MKTTIFFYFLISFGIKSGDNYVVIKNKDKVESPSILQSKQMRLIVFVDRNTSEDLAYKIWIGTNEDWSSFGRKMMDKEAEEGHNKAKMKDFIPDKDCILVYSLIVKGLKKYKRYSGTKEQVQKKAKEYPKDFKTFNMHEIKCI